MRLLYKWRFTNWLIAKPWRWHYRALYRAYREGVNHPKLRLVPGQHRLRAAWSAFTFPHVHAPWED